MLTYITVSVQVCLKAVCSDEGLTLETSAKHHIPRSTNISTFVDQTHIQRTRPCRKTGFFFKTSLPLFKSCPPGRSKEKLTVCLRVSCLFDFLMYCIASSKKFRRKFQSSCNMASRFSITCTPARTIPNSAYISFLHVMNPGKCPP